MINPLLDRFPAILDVLMLGSVTFRWSSRRLEFIRPVAEELTPEARHVLVDLTRARPVFKRRLAEYDHERARLENLATGWYSDMTSSPAFRQRALALRVAMQACDASQEGAFLSLPEEEVVALAAQRVINQDGEIRSGLIDARFWNRHGAELRNLAPQPEQSLQRQRTRFFNLVSSLEKWLTDRRYVLCTEYDIPAAPASTVRI